MPVGVFPQQGPAPSRVRPGAVRARFGQNLGFATSGVDHQQAEAQLAAEPWNAPVAVAPTPRGWDCQPDLIGHGKAVDPLEDQLEREAELHFQNDEERLVVRRGVGANRNHVAAADLALRLVASGRQEPLDGRVERNLSQQAGLRSRGSRPSPASPGPGSARR